MYIAILPYKVGLLSIPGRYIAPFCEGGILAAQGNPQIISLT